MDKLKIAFGIEADYCLGSQSFLCEIVQFYHIQWHGESQPPLRFLYDGEYMPNGLI